MAGKYGLLSQPTEITRFISYDFDGSTQSSREAPEKLAMVSPRPFLEDEALLENEPILETGKEETIGKERKAEEPPTSRSLTMIAKRLKISTSEVTGSMSSK